MSSGPFLESLLAAKVPVWQVVLLGGTAVAAARLMQHTVCRGGGGGPPGTRATHTSSAAESPKRRGDSSFPAGEDSKLVLVIRTDLGMSKGKIAAQCSHATLACYKRAVRQAPAMLKAWEQSGQAKVTLKCASEDELADLQRQAQAAGLVAQSICDAGRTQIAAGSLTVLGIGPGPVGAIDRVAGHLKLY
ncbi:hypothetical protein GGI04_000787 [Coemansia thaxteri]|uniref:peptidyl-tRNA hydrolase n=1 Tax=Coemansia thaxteri TaxID=2663907 RepID=A0A9W8BIP2_9FUNG|nr:hypothetical protein H4R26_003089 [Coemansia thaxteri]KAJ2009021.1 hypothetical protein GGI04_000787 [Coemansia thaxteri]KAJ2473669.1 hypothetical protein GGI02_000686 [Coemansia sp. RSA 2322]KAJ2481763.1 hypothetical protein EV174_003391 [Coemansia sp. RSA 2320]